MSKRSQARKRQLYGKDSRGGANPVNPGIQAPHNTVAPVVSGTPAVGQTLTSTAGTWTGVPTPVITYQWRATSVDIAGATSATFALTAAQSGKIVDCKVTGTNPSGSESRTGNALSVP
jgi:hypothetical protein